MIHMRALLAVVLGASPAASYAKFEICNGSNETIDTAFAFPSRGDWSSRGWWTIAPGDCAVVDGGRLRNRYYYVFGDGHDGGAWTGDYAFCVEDRSFTIHSNKNCRARGYEGARFFMVDTGDADEFILDLTGGQGGGAPFELDIAPMLMSDPEIARDIRNICSSVCAGNEKRSRIRSAVLRIDPDAAYSTGVIRLDLRSRHKIMSGVIPYDHTEKAEVRFRVHNVSCRAEVTSVGASGFVAQALIDTVDGFAHLLTAGRYGLAEALGRHRICP